MAEVTSTALLASAFVASLGINTHLDYTVGPYANTTVAESSIRYLGVKNIRDSAAHVSTIPIWQRVAAATDAKFINFMNRGSPADMQTTLDLTPALAGLGLLNYVEGANEPDTPPALAVGNSLSYAVSFQQQVYNMGRSLGLPVINLSVGDGWTADDGWQGNYDSIGDLSAYADYANAHTYPSVALGLPYKTVYRLNGLAQLGAVGRPVIISEMGWDTASYSATMVAANMLNGIMDAAWLKNHKTYIYALFDDASGKWGLMNNDGTPRAAGKALHNLTTLLADDESPSYQPSAFTYDMTGTTGTERMLLLAKTDGSYWVSVWDENSPAHAVTLTLPAAAQQIQVFDPMIGTGAVKSVSNAASIGATLAGSPLLFRIVPAAPTAPAEGDTTSPPPTGTSTIITSTASNTTITAQPTTTAIYVYGTGNTVTAGPATKSIQAFAGGNTIIGSSGTATISISGSGSKITVGTGTTKIVDSGSSNVVTFTALNAGLTDIYGYIFARGSTLNLAGLLAQTQWDGAQSSLGNFLKVTISGTTAIVSVVPSGTAGGTSYPIVGLHDQASLTLSTLLQHSVVSSGGSSGGGTVTPSVITSYASNTVITGDAGTTAIKVYGTGNTINGGSGTYTVQAFAGGNTVNTGTGTSTLSIGGAYNRINVGAGNTRINDSGSYNIITLAAPGGGVADIYGYIFTRGTKLNLREVMADTAWTGDQNTLGSFLTVAISGSLATIRVNPTGIPGGASYAVAMLHDHSTLTLTKLLAGSVF